MKECICWCLSIITLAKLQTVTRCLTSIEICYFDIDRNVCFHIITSSSSRAPLSNLKQWTRPTMHAHTNTHTHQLAGSLVSVVVERSLFLLCLFMRRHVYIEKEVSRVFTNEVQQTVVLGEECCCKSAVVRHGIIYHILQGMCSVTDSAA